MATALVRDGKREGQDPPTADPRPRPVEEPHWIDVDRLPDGSRRPLPWPLGRLPPSIPGPPAPSRRRVAVGVAATCCSLFVTLAVVFAHVRPLYIPSLPRGDVVGQVVGSTPGHYFVEYSVPGQSNAENVITASGSAAAGQSVVVRPTGGPDSGTVVSTSLPHLRLGVGALGALSGMALVVGGSFSLWLRMESARDDFRAREEATDYREDAWAGTSNSA